MQVADLYIRVSTDEQADKGYSQRNQEEMLRKYCNLHAIQVRKVIFEDHSAKTFNRPQWKTLLLDFRKHKGGPDLVLFTKWDRFSRNAGDAYQMINILRKLGVEPQAIEQPLDLSIPENKMMLAFYLAAPEVENDRRALNVFYGMRRARKEGRFMGHAPIGYTNRTDPNGRKYIAPDEPQAEIMRWSFEELAAGRYNTEQVWKMAKAKGFKATRNLFWFAIRNPVYCGKIFIPKHKDEEAQFVKGQHKPLISEALFYEVQDILDGRGRKYRLKAVAAISLPLRGFLLCPVCGKVLSGSVSRGRNKYYAYYHCFGACAHRFRADHVNDLLTSELKKYTPNPRWQPILKSFLYKAYHQQTGLNDHGRKQLTEQIKELESKLSKARDLLLSDQIDAADYRAMKAEYEERLNKQQAKLNVMENQPDNFDAILKKGLESLFHLSEIYENGTSEEKRKVIGSVYPEKLTFDGDQLRTTRINEAVRLIYTLDKELGEKETGQSGENPTLSCEVGLPGFEPRQTEPKSVVLPLYYRPIRLFKPHPELYTNFERRDPG
jgi:site-specific DNA recombinase